MSVYLDNAATTPLDPLVLEAMMPYLTNVFGNPSSTHGHGRSARTAVETSRKTIAEVFGVSPSEIYFTSGGTEADNTFLSGAVDSLAIARIITSRIEHPAILQTAEHLAKSKNIEVTYVQLDSKGGIDLDHLGTLMAQDKQSLVTLMHANNEIANLLDLSTVAGMATETGTIFHTDAVQTVGHQPLALNEFTVHGLSASAHKFHGPKGHGFMYVRKGHHLDQLIRGGSQERNMRGGTESVHGIVGTARALELATINLQHDIAYVSDLKQRMIAGLLEAIPGVSFNGYSADLKKSNYTVLSVSLPPSEKNEMLLFTLDLEGISASGGSACASGSTVGSHVLTELHTDPNRQTIRFSFSRFNTEEEIDYAVAKLREILAD